MQFVFLVGWCQQMLCYQRLKRSFIRDGWNIFTFYTRSYVNSQDKSSVSMPILHAEYCSMRKDTTAIFCKCMFWLLVWITHAHLKTSEFCSWQLILHLFAYQSQRESLFKSFGHHSSARQRTHDEQYLLNAAAWDNIFYRAIKSSQFLSIQIKLIKSWNSVLVRLEQYEGRAQ